MPEEFGRYRLIEIIGRGGMGEVHRAVDTVRNRQVAIKLLPTWLAGDEAFENRFRRESQLAAQLNEPHIIPIHDFGEIDGRLFIDMRLVEGQDLASVLAARGSLPPAAAVEIIGQAAAALDAAHADGLVHRDVKPSNILLSGGADRIADPDAPPFAYLVDFGIARSAGPGGTALTATSTTVGTIAYMSPERISGAPSDLRTDVYALACVLYESLTGRKPFDGEMLAQMYAHLHHPIPRASDIRPDVPAALDDVIATGMAKSPEDRYASAGRLASAARAALRSAARTGTRARPLDTVTGTDRPSSPAPSGPVRTDPTESAAPRPAPPRPAPPPSAAPRPAQAAGAPVQSGPVQSGPVQSGPVQSGPVQSGPVQSGPVRFAPPPQWSAAPPGATPPGGTAPFPGGGGPAPRRRSRRTAVLVAALVVLLVAGAAVGYLATRGSGGGAVAGPSGLPSSAPHGSPGTSSDAPTLSTGAPGDGTVSWSHFASFSSMLGSRDHDSAHAFGRADCTLDTPDSTDAGQGVRDEVHCDLPSSTEQFAVARFGSAAQVQNYLRTHVDKGGYSQLIWATDAEARGQAIVSPSQGSGPSIITTSVCALPTYLVQVGAPDRLKVSTVQLHDDVWDKATFPDVTPPQCNSAYVGSQGGAQASASSGPAKQVLTMDATVVRTLIQRGDTTVQVAQVPVSGASQAIGAGQHGSVTFFVISSDTLRKIGASTYPYARSSLGPPDVTTNGTVLSGMTNATFIVRGTFSGDGSGNAVAYTDGGHGWGAIKALSSGDLGASAKGVGISGIGLSDDFGFSGGRLETIDCSSRLSVSQCSGNNRVIKFWTWRTDHFEQTGSAGLSH